MLCIKARKDNGEVGHHAAFFDLGFKTEIAISANRSASLVVKISGVSFLKI